jgi:diadenosine tetraphosphate (Ap4A) HIT family hydrolase
MQDPNCVFCKIIAGEIPAKVIMQNEKAMALLDAFPLAAGHSLVIPLRQVLKLTLLQLQSTMEMRQARRCPMYMRILFQEKEAMVPVPSTLCSKLSQN